MKNTVRLLCLMTLCRHGTFIGRSVSFQGLKALCGCRFTHTLQHSLAKLCLVTVCIIAVLGDHSVCFSGTLCSNTRTYAAVQRSKAPPGGPSCIQWAGGGWLGVAGGLCVRPILPRTFSYYQHHATTALCWSRGASRYFRNHAGSCRGQRGRGLSRGGDTRPAPSQPGRRL